MNQIIKAFHAASARRLAANTPPSPGETGFGVVFPPDDTQVLPRADMLGAPYRSPHDRAPTSSAVSWRYNVNGVWSTAADWTGGAVPGAANNVVLSTLSARTITFASGTDSVAGLTATTDTLAVTGGVLTVLGNASFGAGLTIGSTSATAAGDLILAAQSVTVAGAFNNDNGYLTLGSSTALTLTGTVTLDGVYYNAAAEIDGGNLLTTNTTNIINDYSQSYEGVVLGGGVVWTNSGIVNDAATIGYGDTNGLTAAIVNAAGGTINFNNTGAGVYSYVSGASATFLNAGTLNNNVGDISDITAVFTNSGVVNIGTGGIEFLGGGSFGGTLTGAGEIAFTAGIATISAGSNFTVANWLINGASVAMSTALNYAGNLSLTSGTLTLDGTKDAVTGSYYQNAGYLYLNGSTLTVSGAAFGGGGYLEGGGTLITNGTTTLENSYYYLGGGAAWINHGTFNQGAQIYYDTSSGFAISFTNSASATYNAGANESFGGNYGGYFGTFTNAGAFNVSGGTSYMYAAFYNTGTINVSGGALYFEQGGSFGGTLTGGGTMVFGGGASTLTANASYSGANLQLSGGTLTLAGNTTPASGSYDQTAGYLDLNGNTLTLVSATLAAGYIEGSGGLLTSGTTNIAANSNFWLGGNLSWVNTGIVNQASYLYSDYSSGGTFDLQNAAGAIYNITGGVGFGYNNDGLVPTLENAGIFGKTGGGNSTSLVEAYITNTGTIQSTIGTLAFYEGGVISGTLSGAGTIAFQSGYYTIEAGAAVNAGAILIDGGTVVLDESLIFAAGQFAEQGGTLFLNGNTLSLTGGGLYGYVEGAGAILTAGTTNLASTLWLGGGVVWSNTGTVAQTTSYIYNDANNPGGATINNQAGAKYNFGIDGYLFYNGNGSIDNFNNAGVFSKTGGTGVAYIDANFTNTGTIATTSTTGTIQFQGGGTFGGTINGSGTVEFYNAGFNLGGLTSAAATYIDAYAAALYLTGNVSIAGAFMAVQSCYIGLDGDALTLNGSNTFNSTNNGSGYDYISGPGTIATTGATSVGSYSTYIQLYVTDGASWINSGTVADTGMMALSDSSGAGTITNTSKGAFNLTTDSASIEANTYYGTFINAGTLAKTGGSLTSHIYATVLDTGVLASTTGTLELDNGGTLAGTIADKSNIVLANAGSFAETTLLIGGGASLTNNVTVTENGTLTLGDSTTAKAGVFANAGVFDIIGASAILSGSSSTNQFANSGLLEQTITTGRSVISASIANSGTIAVDSGTLALTGTVTGVGALQIGAGATLEIGSNVGTAQAVSFLTNSGTLLLDAASAFKEKITGFTVGTVIDLAGIAANGASLSGTLLTLTENGTAVATLSLTGTHTGDTYSFMSDGHGGTLLGVAANASTWKGVTADWNTAADWNNGVPDLQTNAIAAGTNAYTLSLASNETAYINNLALSDSKATYSLNGVVYLGGTLALSAGTLNLGAGGVYGGTISVTGGTLNYNNAYFDNVTYAGALNLTAANAMLSIDGSFTQTGSSTINLTGSGADLYFYNITTLNGETINIGGATSAAALTAYDNYGTGGVLILGATTSIMQTGIYAALNDSGGAYAGVFNEGSISAGVKGGSFAISGSDFQNDGTISISNGDVFSINSAAIVNTGTITANGATLAFGANVQNTGAISVNGGTLSIAVPIQNTGSISSTNAVLDLAGTFTLAQAQTYLGSGDTLQIGGELLNTGNTLTIGTGSALGQIQLTGTIEGGTIVDLGNGIATNGGSTNGAAISVLSDVTYDGTLAIGVNDYLWIEGSFTSQGVGGATPGAISISAAGADLLWLNSRTVDNTNITLGNNTAAAYFEIDDATGHGNTLTLGQHANITQSGTLADVYYDQANDVLINGGIINADTAGGSFSIGGYGGANGTFTNSGSIVVSAGDTLLFNTGVVLSNMSGATINGGYFEADANSTIQLANNANITTDNATIVLSGAKSTVEWLNTGTNKQVTLDSKLTAIGTSGVLQLLNARAFAASAAFTDGGVLQLGAGASFTGASGLSISSTGTLQGNGTVTAAITDSGAINATGGTLVLAGAVSGAGALAAATGATLDLTAGGALSEIVSGAGTLQLDGATAYTDAGATIGIAAIHIDAGAILSGAATIAGAVANAGTLAANGGTLLVQGAIAGAGALQAAAGAVLDLAGGGTITGAISGGGILQLDGTAPLVLLAGASLGVAAVRVDAGAILDMTQGGALSGTVTGAGTVQLDGAAAYTLAGGTITIGSIADDAGATLSGFGTISGAIADNGSLIANGGTLLVTGLLSGAGTLQAAAGAVLELTGGGTLTPSLSGAGTLQLDGASYAATATNFGIAVINVDAGAALSASGTIVGTVNDAGTVSAVSGVLALTGQVTGAGTLAAATGATLDLTVAETMTQAITGAGTLQLDSASFTLGNALTIANVLVDSGASLIGAGTIAGALVNNGVVSTTSGELSLAGAVSGTGSFVTVAGTTLDLLGGGALAGAFSGGGTLQLDSAVYSIAATETIQTAATVIDSGASLIGAGTFANAVTDSGSISAAGTLDFLAAMTGAGALSASAGGLLVLNGGGALAETITGAGGITLQGGVAYTLSGQTDTISTFTVGTGATLSGTGSLVGSVIDNGVIIATAGVLALATAPTGNGALQAASGGDLYIVGGGTLNNAISGAGMLELGGATTLGTGTITVANLLVDAAGMLSGAGTLASVITDNGSLTATGGTLTVKSALANGTGTLSASAGAALVLSGGGTFAGALAGAGAVDISAALTLNAGASFAGANIVETANVTLGTNVTNFNETSGATVTISAASGKITELTGGSGSTFINAGSLVGSGAGTAEIGNAFINNASVSVGSGTLTFLGNVTNNGAMNASAGLLTLQTNVLGTGTLNIGATGTLSLLAGAVATQTVDFLAGTGLLDLTMPKTFLGTIAGFGGGDQIDLLKTAETSFTYSGGVLTVKNGTATTATLHFSGTYTQSEFTLASDGHSGTLITFV